MSATSPPVAYAQTMSLLSTLEYAGLLEGNGSVADSASSWLMVVVTFSSGVRGSPWGEVQLQMIAYGIDVEPETGTS